MRGLPNPDIWTLTIMLCCLCLCRLASAEILSEHLSVISSANPESNAIQSFIIIREGQFLKEGIGKQAKSRLIGQQPPFVIEFKKKPTPAQILKWDISVVNKQHGTVNILSSFKGKGRVSGDSYTWTSGRLDSTSAERHRLIFRPKPFTHQPVIYKKGKGPQGKRRKYGGGTRNIDEKKYNPQFIYQVTLSIIEKESTIEQHKATLTMDYKDMIRQEYINHYNIKRYGRGENGNIPIPLRSEINQIPPRPADLEGNPLTESRYKLVINDGMLDLAKKINKAFLNKIKELKASQAFYDLNDKKIEIPKAKLWVSSGWRNPERNEWYSNAVNGVHQRGGAVDFVILSPPNSTDSAIAYWILWSALNDNKESINAFWQLETNGRPMTTREFKQDLEPENGIPDAFDKADHLHANIHY